MRPDWNTTTKEEKAEIIDRLAKKGESSSQIAAHFKGANRNMVIGFRHRHGVSTPRKPGPAPNPNSPPRKRRPRVAKPKPSGVPLSRPSAMPAKTAAMPPMPPPTGPAVPFFRVLAEGGCKWPLFDRIEGDPALAPFCGAPRAEGRPYCSHHQMIGTERR